MKIDLEICLPRDARTLPIIRHIAMCALDELGVAPTDVDDVALALTEACTNVVKHSEADDEYAVHLVVSDNVCEISVVDSGRGFDSSLLAKGMAPDTAEAGRGLALVSALVDGLRLESRPQEGTIVHLVKELRLNEGAALDHLLTQKSGDGRNGRDGRDGA